MDFITFKEICKKNKERENNIQNMYYYYSQKLNKKVDKKVLREKYHVYFSYYLWQKNLNKDFNNGW